MAWPNKDNGSGDKPGNVYEFKPKLKQRRPQGEWPISPSFLGLSCAFVLMAGIMLFTPQFARGAVFPMVVAGWLISLCLHEFGHAFTAYKYGDVTVKDQGYLTLDPLKYGDPMNSVLFPILIVALGGIGLPGGSVFVKTQLFREPWQRAVMSAAGPFMNLVCLVVLMTILNVFSGTMAASPVLRASLAFLALLQITSIVFNLLPVPGFDGWGVIEPWLPRGAREFGYQVAPYASLVVLMLVFFAPPFRDLIWGIVDMIARPLGLNYSWSSQGYRMFQFWR